MNIVSLTGRLVRDADVKVTTSNITVARFTLAVNRQKKDDGADFIGCVAFGKTAEVIQKYTSKGSQIGVQGRIQTGSYDGKDGKKVYTTDIIVDRMEFLGTKPNGQTSAPAPASAPVDGFHEMDDDDDALPF